MPRNIKQRFLSIWAWISSILSRKDKQPSAASSLPTALYRTADKTPVYVLRQCLIHSNLNTLIITGQPTQADLAEAWAQLFGEYFDLIKSGRSKYIQTLQKNIGIRFVEITTIENACLLATETINQVQETLTAMSTGVDMRPFEVFREAMVRETNKLAFAKLKQTQDSEELENLLNEQGTTKEEENYFDRMIVRLFEKFGFFDEKVITVAQLCAMMKIYIDDSKITKDARSGVNK